MSSFPHNTKTSRAINGGGNQETNSDDHCNRNMHSALVPASASIDLSCSVMQENALGSTNVHFPHDSGNPSMPPAPVTAPQAVPDLGSQQPSLPPDPANEAPSRSFGLENRVEPATFDRQQAAMYANLIACVANLRQQTVAAMALPQFGHPAASSLQRMMYTAANIHEPQSSHPAAIDSALPASPAAIQPASATANSAPSRQMAPSVAAPPSTGKVLSLDQDEVELSPYQCLVRKQIELFEAPPENLMDHGSNTTQGRNRPIRPGQVGIRCRHCGSIPAARTRGAVLFPSTLLGLYQTAQNMANTHLVKFCQLIPEATRNELIAVRSREKGKKTRKSGYGGGRQYWADSLRVFGVVEAPDRRLEFSSSRS